MPKIPTIEELLKAGAHFGHKTSKWHPRMEKNIFGSRQDIHIINLEKTQLALEQALSFVKKTTSRGGTVLLIGTKKQAAPIVEKYAAEAEIPYVNKRWLGGTFTNFAVINQVIRKYKDLKRKQEKGELVKYTKFEQQKFNEQIEKLDDSVGGIQNLTKIPEAIFILDIRKDKTALQEAKRRGVKVVALCDTNVDPTDVDFPIPCNDDAVNTLEIIVKLMTEACKEGRNEWETNRARLGSTLKTTAASFNPDNK
ncbi:MAG: 30S ribosomal protein S2 [Patescibacteria group bacterium]|nr:30S ribosomal protein S2 [Patescibacteria group bacterium]MBU2509289.1 30S ribosomal protein S2 [Patescibacteria group bacterium]